MPSDLQLAEFKDTVWDYYRNFSRMMPWRIPEPDGTFDAYKILVSEMMLQQTQVSRVVEKYTVFHRLFPTIEALAAAPLSVVLIVWQGLGYNRRARYLHEAAKNVQVSYSGRVPDSRERLITLPGIGPETAGAILVYAYNRPEAFIETNVRTVYIHHFFADMEKVDDKVIRPIVAQTIDQDNPREWYWALMDYGTFIKKTEGNPNRQGKSYAKQSQFEGSFRQIRGKILRELANGPVGNNTLEARIGDDRLQQALDSLAADRLVVQRDGQYKLAD